MLVVAGELQRKHISLFFDLRTAAKSSPGSGTGRRAALRLQGCKYSILKKCHVFCPFPGQRALGLPVRLDKAKAF